MSKSIIELIGERVLKIRDLQQRVSEQMAEIEKELESAELFLSEFATFDKPLPLIGDIVYQQHKFVLAPYVIDMSKPFEVINMSIDKHATTPEERIAIQVEWLDWDGNTARLTLPYAEFVEDFGNEIK